MSRDRYLVVFRNREGLLCRYPLVGWDAANDELIYRDSYLQRQVRRSRARVYDRQTRRQVVFEVRAK